MSLPPRLTVTGQGVRSRWLCCSCSIPRGTRCKPNQIPWSCLKTVCLSVCYSERCDSAQAGSRFPVLPQNGCGLAGRRLISNSTPSDTLVPLSRAVFLCGSGTITPLSETLAVPSGALSWLIAVSKLQRSSTATSCNSLYCGPSLLHGPTSWAPPAALVWWAPPASRAAGASAPRAGRPT